jgi:hypothetical protein
MEEEWPMTTKTVDSKGRIALGKRFANKPVIIEEISPTEIRVVMARLIPEQEAWLLENEPARTSVLRGLKQAKARQFSKRAPDLDADDSLVKDLDD